MKKQILFLMLCISLLLSGCQKTTEAPPAAQLEETVQEASPWETAQPDDPLSYTEYFAETRTYDTADYAYSPAWLQTGEHEIDCRDGELALYRASDGERLTVYAEQPFLSWRTGSDGVYVFREQDILRCAYDGKQTETLYAAQDGTIISFAASGDVLFFAEKTAYRIRLCRLYAPEERLDVLYDAVSPDAEGLLLFPVSNHELCWSMENPAFLALAEEQKQTYIETKNLDPDDQSTYWGMLELDFDINSGIRYYYNDLTQELRSQEFRIIYGEEDSAEWWKTEDNSRRGTPSPDQERLGFAGANIGQGGWPGTASGSITEAKPTGAFTGRARTAANRRSCCRRRNMHPTASMCWAAGSISQTFGTAFLSGVCARMERMQRNSWMVIAIRSL